MIKIVTTAAGITAALGLAWVSAHGVTPAKKVDAALTAPSSAPTVSKAYKAF